mmetsp:Transcript_7386/g.16759  ORF Transcript_7386/g.16759 Transcript_7386/m.16759 type:complete len:185 (-) Transcript_7386:154-708(-)
MASELSTLIDRELELVDREVGSMETDLHERVDRMQNAKRICCGLNLKSTTFAGFFVVFFLLILVSLLGDAHVKLNQETRRRRELEMQLRTISMNGTDTTKGKEPDTPKVTCTTTNTLDEEERAELDRLRAQQQNCSALTTLYAKHGEMLKVLDNQTTVEEFAASHGNSSCQFGYKIACAPQHHF